VSIVLHKRPGKLRSHALHKNPKSLGRNSHLFPLLLLIMLKRGRGGFSSSKTRKRKRNGVSTSSAVLDFGGSEAEIACQPAAQPFIPSGNTQVMRVWHTKVESPFASRKSTVLVPSEPPTGEANDEGCRGDSEDTPEALSVVPSRPRRKRGNDSVSPLQTI
jgi:hypothetical protein